MLHSVDLNQLFFPILRHLTETRGFRSSCYTLIPSLYKQLGEILGVILTNMMINN